MGRENNVTIALHKTAGSIYSELFLNHTKTLDRKTKDGIQESLYASAVVGCNTENPL